MGRTPKKCVAPKDRSSHSNFLGEAWYSETLPKSHRILSFWQLQSPETRLLKCFCFGVLVPPCQFFPQLHLQEAGHAALDASGRPSTRGEAA